jgi:hypothetical protein
MMDDWHRKVAEQIAGHTRSRGPHGPSDAESALEIAFGRARAVLAYALELARAHRVAVTGNTGGDDVWVQLGTGPRARFILNRREARVVVYVPAEGPRVVGWAPGAAGQGAVVDEAGARVDLEVVARGAIDALFAGWAMQPALEAPSHRGGSDAREFEDEPTKG